MSLPRHAAGGSCGGHRVLRPEEGAARPAADRLGPGCGVTAVVAGGRCHAVCAASTSVVFWGLGASGGLALPLADRPDLLRALSEKQARTWATKARIRAGCRPSSSVSHNGVDRGVLGRARTGFSSGAKHGARNTNSGPIFTLSAHVRLFVRTTPTMGRACRPALPMPMLPWIVGDSHPEGVSRDGSRCRSPPRAAAPAAPARQLPRPARSARNREISFAPSPRAGEEKRRGKRAARGQATSMGACLVRFRPMAPIACAHRGRPAPLPTPIKAYCTMARSRRWLDLGGASGADQWGRRPWYHPHWARPLWLWRARCGREKPGWLRACTVRLLTKLRGRGPQPSLKPMPDGGSIVLRAPSAQFRPTIQMAR